jgi:Uma2 family endonuclease
MQVGNWAKADGTGIVFSSATGFRLPDGSLFVPDASWVCRERWDTLTLEEQEDFAPLCPDAVFEVAFPSDNAAVPPAQHSSRRVSVSGNH